ncbi:MAG: hypothetical protein QM534_01905 [Sediminibacterium sp.]|nr:hypothetical protein [Sediminibacterium sp.]
MATSNFNVPFNKGQIMFWSWTTQAANQVFVTLADSSTTYINGNRQSTNPLPPPTPGAATIGGSNLKLTINVPSSNQLIPSIASGNITDSSGNVVGEYFNLAIEDGSDGDFNDIWVSLVAWNTGG